VQVSVYQYSDNEAGGINRLGKKGEEREREEKK
jgi:hypothetical protein